MDVLNKISEARKQGKKQLSILIDPDKTSDAGIDSICNSIACNPVDFIFVGGSLLTNHSLHLCINRLKKGTSVPLVLFPGNTMQIHEAADALLFLSLISGRNAEMLIGNHVVAAPIIRQYELETIPTGYLLIESGTVTSVEYMSNTRPIPYLKDDIAACTAIAGEMLGLKMIYMDAGSGAKFPIREEMIQKVREYISLPLIIGGGIKDVEIAQKIYAAGADMIVVGSAIEKKTSLISEFSDLAIRFS